MGLRERKKQRMYQGISDAAIALFLENGFDGVSVEQVAAAAEVSKPTLFRYFSTKEDLALHRFADHEDEPSRVVEARPQGVSPLTALHEHFLACLLRRDPVTGLNDDPRILAFHGLLYGTPRLVARLYVYMMRSEEALSVSLGGDATEARLAASQIVAVQRILAQENWRRVEAGERAEDVYPSSVAAADRAFAQLCSGLVTYA
ncbi:TetR/AcrR family transcriptional regulator [Streptomyces sp. NPDC057638]|uniref:TetR/AcrR family transcriptional regulator n=1 Tax=Streptomyces sp. NPDC057638 TaxID=3346190 RepID=UPI0036C4F223